jgi:hypothetical protein
VARNAAAAANTFRSALSTHFSASASGNWFAVSSRAIILPTGLGKTFIASFLF